MAFDPAGRYILRECARRRPARALPKVRCIWWSEVRRRRLTSNPDGLPILDGCIAYIECSLYEIHDAGDHEIAIGRVLDLRPGRPSQPLVYFRGCIDSSCTPRICQPDFYSETSTCTGDSATDAAHQVRVALTRLTRGGGRPRGPAS